MSLKGTIIKKVILVISTMTILLSLFLYLKKNNSFKGRNMEVTVINNSFNTLTATTVISGGKEETHGFLPVNGKSTLGFVNLEFKDMSLRWGENDNQLSLFNVRFDISAFKEIENINEIKFIYKGECKWVLQGINQTKEVLYEVIGTYVGKEESLIKEDLPLKAGLVLLVERKENNYKDFKKKYLTCLKPHDDNYKFPQNNNTEMTFVWNSFSKLETPLSGSIYSAEIIFTKDGAMFFKLFIWEDPFQYLKELKVKYDAEYGVGFLLDFSVPIKITTKENFIKDCKELKKHSENHRGDNK